MTRRHTLYILLLLASPLMAQTTTTTDPFDFRIRASVGVEKRIVKGFNAFVSEEVVTRDNVTNLSKLKTQAGLSYKPIPYFKMAADYTFYAIWHDPNSRHSSEFWDLRHRFRFHLYGIYKYRGWSFQLRESFQTTTKTEDINLYQEPQTLLELRSKLKVGYDCQSVPLSPYISCELTNTLNAAQFNEARTEVTYDHAYIDKIRTTLGMVYQPGKRHEIDFALFYDRKYDYEWDATRKGKFKSVTYVIGNDLNLSVGYTFKF